MPNEFRVVRLASMAPETRPKFRPTNVRFFVGQIPRCGSEFCIRLDSLFAVSCAKSSALVVGSAVEFVMLRLAIEHPSKKKERRCTQRCPSRGKVSHICKILYYTALSEEGRTGAQIRARGQTMA